MNSYKPRRPAQLKPDQIELIEGSADIAEASELAHTTADVVVPLPGRPPLDVGVRERVQALLESEGIDTLAESWVAMPAESLPGALWRGYLLREWIRRFPSEAAARFAAARAASDARALDLATAQLVHTPAAVKALWDQVFAGGFAGDFHEVLRESARLTNFLGSVIPGWIGDDAHPLATAVTRRDTAMLRTAAEFEQAEALLAAKLLH